VDSVLTEMANLLKREDSLFPTEGFRVGGGLEVIVHLISFFGGPRLHDAAWQWDGADSPKRHPSCREKNKGRATSVWDSSVA